MRLGNLGRGVFDRGFGGFLGWEWGGGGGGGFLGLGLGGVDLGEGFFEVFDLEFPFEVVGGVFGVGGRAFAAEGLDFGLEGFDDGAKGEGAMEGVEVVAFAELEKVEGWRGARLKAKC